MTMYIVAEHRTKQTLVACSAFNRDLKRSTTQRIQALDFTKGALVLIMVLYHWINYFVGLEWPYYRFLRFLTPSFIFITGYMISHVYLSKFTAADPRLRKRLLIRGLKIFVIFLVLNLARDIVVPHLGAAIANHNTISVRTLSTFFVSGIVPDAGPKLISFSILVPISYLLVVSAILMIPYSHYKYTFHVTCIGLMLSSVVLGFASCRNYNLEFVSIGLLGVIIGFAPSRAFGILERHPGLLACAYLGYLIATAVWNVPFLLLILGVLLNLCILHMIGKRGSKQDLFRSEVVLLGRYSLWGYISQIVILQLLSEGVGRRGLGRPGLAISLLAAFSLTILTVDAIDHARGKSVLVDKLYRIVFV